MLSKLLKAKIHRATVTMTDVNYHGFFAVTYDGTALTDNVKFYRGYRNADEAGAQPVFSQVGTGTITGGGMTVDQAGSLIVGNTDGQTRPFRGFLDDMRVYGSKTDASGALTEQLVQDVHSSAVPEPATLGLLGLGAAQLMRRRR